MKVALVYDRVNKWGGAERVLLALHSIFPKAPLFTSVYYKKGAPWAKKFIVKTSFLQNIPMAKKSHELFPIFMPKAFESFSFKKYDVVISVTSEAAKGIIVPKKTLHVCYCLTPTRYLWSGYNEYFKNPFAKFISFPFVLYLRLWDKKAAKRPDVMIAISNEVKRRIKKYYKRDSVVIYPPLTLKLGRWKASFKRSSKKENYYLVVSRLVEYKRIDIAIDAFNKLGLPLKIIGIGKSMNKLKKIAGPTIEFLGNLTDSQVVEYYKNCRAVIFPGREDFGLSAVEAQYFGKPVIAFRAGGAMETIREGKTGEFFYPQKASALTIAVKKSMKKRYNAKAIHDFANTFSEKRFKKELLQAVETHV